MNRIHRLEYLLGSRLRPSPSPCLAQLPIPKRVHPALHPAPISIRFYARRKQPTATPSLATTSSTNYKNLIWKKVNSSLEAIGFSQPEIVEFIARLRSKRAGASNENDDDISRVLDSCQKGIEELKSLGIPTRLLKRLLEQTDITTPTISQSQLLSHMLKSKSPSPHIVIKDYTGSGKTFGLVMGLLARYTNKRSSTNGATKVLFIVPHRELAVQIHEWMKWFLNMNDDKELKSIVQCIVSGIDVSSQINQLTTTPPTILIATPVRLLEILDQQDSCINVMDLETLVLDEFDNIVRVLSRHATLKKKYNQVVHPRPGEVLIEKIFQKRDELLLKNVRQQVEKKPKLNESIMDTETKELQFIISSATWNRQAYRELLRRKWISTEPIVIDMITKKSDTGKKWIKDEQTDMALLPKSIVHECTVVMPSGVHPFEKVYREMETHRKMLYAQQQKTSDAEVAEYTPPQYIALDDPALPDDDDSVLEYVATTMRSESIGKALLFVPSSISLTNLVNRLCAMGVKADKMLNVVDYHAATGFEKQVDTEGTADDKKKNNTSKPFAPFLDGEIELLCGTEHTARGIDLPNVSHVFILGLPSSSNSYVHMAGRTGRLEAVENGIVKRREGKVITVLPGKAFVKKFSNLLNAIQVKIGNNDEKQEDKMEESAHRNKKSTQPIVPAVLQTLKDFV